MMITLNEVFRKSFFEGFAGSDIGAFAMLAAMVTSLILAIYLFYIYRLATKHSFYSHGFALSLVGVCLVTAGIIVTVQSSIVISLGTVGALSIVRFRTAIKDPLDLFFLFWAISCGIMCGAGYAEFGIILSLVLTLALFILGKMPGVQSPMMLVINAGEGLTEAEITRCLNEYAGSYKVKARSISDSGSDYTIELKTDRPEELLKAVSAMPSVNNATILTRDGGVTY